MPQLKLVKAVDTRWLSHDKAVSVVRKSYAPIVISLEKEASERHDATAQGLSKFVHKFKFVASLAMLADVLPVLSILSKAFQVC